MLHKIPGKREPYLFFIKFLLCFFFLYFVFQFFWGVTGVGGRFYSSFIDNHFNIIKGFTGFLTKAAKVFLAALNYNAFQKDFHSLRIGSTGGVNVNPSCLGWGVMSFWFAFVYANNGSWKHKLKWIFGGLISICVLNIMRIALITLALHLRLKTFTSLNHHSTFNIISYCLVFVLIYRYLQHQKKYEES